MLGVVGRLGDGPVAESEHAARNAMALTASAVLLIMRMSSTSLDGVDQNWPGTGRTGLGHRMTVTWSTSDRMHSS